MIIHTAVQSASDQADGILSILVAQLLISFTGTLQRCDFFLTFILETDRHKVTWKVKKEKGGRKENKQASDEEGLLIYIAHHGTGLGQIKQRTRNSIHVFQVNGRDLIR